MPHLDFEQPLGFIPLCVLLAAAGAYVLYSGASPWRAKTNRMLAGVRFILLSILLLLLLNPLLNQRIKEVEKPAVVIGIDNSLSITHHLDTLQQAQLLQNIKRLKSKLQAEGYDVALRSLSQRQANLNAFNFDEKTTDLHQWLRQVSADYEGKNLAGAYLISDGRYNRGISPVFSAYGFMVNTVGIGDTLQKEDLVLKNILFNQIAYQGNRFPVAVEILNHGMHGTKTTLEISRGQQLIASKKVAFSNKDQMQTIRFDLEANKNGIQQLDITLKQVDGEAVSTNNSQSIVVDVVNGKKKILLLSPAPHPDLKALNAVISQNKNYELARYIPGFNEYRPDKYDLIIIHQPYSGNPKIAQLLAEAKQQHTPQFLIMGQKTDRVATASAEDFFSFRAKGTRPDVVFPSPNERFDLFPLPEHISSDFQHFSPIGIPYAEVPLPATAQALLYQRIGSVVTQRPLLYVNEANGEKSAYMLSEGLWKWRMQEYARTESTQSFDECILKLIQYLSVKEDKRRLRFYPSADTYYEGDPIHFYAELYDALYERVYNLPIDVRIASNDEAKTYHFTPTSPHSALDLADFSPGAYRYTAQATLSGKKQKVEGKFFVKALQLEPLDQVADFNLLKHLAYHTGGKFYLGSGKEWVNETPPQPAKAVVHTHEDILPLLHLQWIFYFLLAMVTLEWAVRKYSGAY